MYFFLNITAHCPSIHSDHCDAVVDLQTTCSEFRVPAATNTIDYTALPSFVQHCVMAYCYKLHSVMALIDSSNALPSRRRELFAFRVDEHLPARHVRCFDCDVQ